MTENYRASFEVARRQVARAERAGDEWGSVVEAIHGLARSARCMEVNERQKVLRELDRAAGAAEHPGFRSGSHQKRGRGRSGGSASARCSAREPP